MEANGVDARVAVFETSEDTKTIEGVLEASENIPSSILQKNDN